MMAQSVSLALSPTSVYTARPWSQCIAWCPCLHRSFHWYTLRLPTEGWPGWVDLGGWLRTKMIYPFADGLNIQVLTGPGVG